MKFAVLSAFAIAIFLTSGCAAVAETSSEAKKAMTETKSGGDPIAEAKAAYKEAKAAGCAWRDTNKMIKKAEALAKDGKSEEANKLAGRATRQSQLGMAQCESEKKRLGAT